MYKFLFIKMSKNVKQDRLSMQAYEQWAVKEGKVLTFLWSQIDLLECQKYSKVRHTMSNFDSVPNWHLLTTFYKNDMKTKQDWMYTHRGGGHLYFDNNVKSFQKCQTSYLDQCDDMIV